MFTLAILFSRCASITLCLAIYALSDYNHECNHPKICLNPPLVVDLNCQCCKN